MHLGSKCIVNILMSRCVEKVWKSWKRCLAEMLQFDTKQALIFYNFPSLFLRGDGVGGGGGGSLNEPLLRYSDIVMQRGKFFSKRSPKFTNFPRLLAPSL